jgi:predicted patatin/cPLA2 family phospholipase
LHEVAMQLFTKFDRTGLRPLYYTADRMHQNFYENIMARDEVETNISFVKELLTELEVIRNSSTIPFVPQNHDQRRRLDRLTRRP